MATGRTFVAIYPPPEVADVVAELDRTAPSVRWVPPDQWHVTLRFLGDRSDVDSIDERLRTTFRHEPVRAVLGPGVDHFDRQVLLLPVAGLEALATAIDEALAPIVEPRERPFVGHLTLGRSRRRTGRLPLVGDPAAASFTVDSIVLVRSELTRDGARHERVGNYQLSESS